MQTARSQRRKLERKLAKQPKEIRELVKVWRMENSPNGDIPVFAFMTYGWTFPLYWSLQGKIKSGVSNDPNDDGTIRMTQACSKKTPIAEQPRVIKELKQVWEIPVDLVGLDKSAANKIRNTFDKRCNSALSKYKVKDVTSPLAGEEWYREISIEEIKTLRSNIWEDLLIELGTAAIKKEYKKMSPRGLQTPAIKAIIKEFKEGTARCKGIAPTGFGKTVVAFLTIAKLKAQGLLKNRIVMMTAPNQFLANKNAAAFNEYAVGNKIRGIYNIPVFSGSDLGFAESHIEVLERNEKLAAIIQGYLQDDPTAIIVLHTCNPSVQLVDDVLDSIGITEIDFAICDEAHTLASTYDSRWNFILTDHKVKIKSRFFLTATEKTLSNPDFLVNVPNRGERVAKFNYMNNKEIFGDYCFKFSFAQGVDAGHIVPMIAKVFEYSNGNTEVSELLEFIDALDIPELKSVTDENGIAYDYFDKKLARSIISIISAFEDEGRNKSLTICSRNAHVDLLIKVAKAIQNSGKYLQGIELTDIKARDYSPSQRQDLLDDIHDSDKKQIVVVGPWAITGVDCPSLDHIHWNFTPGTEISLTQGTGRGARLHKGKQNVLVTFNLDLDNPIALIKSKVSSTILKLHESMFPSHDVKLRERVRRVAGRRFLRVKKDDSSAIEPSIRISLDRIYEATKGYDLLSIINSAFIHHRNKDQWATEFILENIDTITEWTEDPNRTLNMMEELSKMFFQKNKVLINSATFINKLRKLYEEGIFKYPITSDHKYDYFKKELLKDIASGEFIDVIGKFIEIGHLIKHCLKYDSIMIFRCEKPIEACITGYGFSRKYIRRFAKEHGYSLVRTREFKKQFYKQNLKKIIRETNIREVSGKGFLTNHELLSFLVNSYSNIKFEKVFEHKLVNTLGKTDRFKMGKLLYHSNIYNDLPNGSKISLGKSCAANGYVIK